ncbi:hypothetical protein ACIBCN_11945 [Nocardia sp. NPDC051052]
MGIRRPWGERLDMVGGTGALNAIIVELLGWSGWRIQYGYS